MTRKCPVCQIDFTPIRNPETQKYCSSVCYKARGSVKVSQQKCDWCGEIFEQYETRRPKSHVFCGRRCSKLWVSCNQLDKRVAELSARKRSDADVLLVLIRHKLQISQQGIGELLGVHKSSIARWETQLVAPEPENYEKIRALARQHGISF